MPRSFPSIRSRTDIEIEASLKIKSIYYRGQVTRYFSRGGLIAVKIPGETRRRRDIDHQRRKHRSVHRIANFDQHFEEESVAHA